MSTHEISPAPAPTAASRWEAQGDALLQVIWHSADLIFIVVLMFASGGVMSSALLSRDFLVGTDLRNASSSAAVDSLASERRALKQATSQWSDAALKQQTALVAALGRKPDMSIKVAQARYEAERMLDANGGGSPPRPDAASDQPPVSAASSILRFCAARPDGCRDAPRIQSALSQVMFAESQERMLDGEIATRQQALRDINREVLALQDSPLYPDGSWLAKREVRYALDQWKAYEGNPILRPFVIFASAPIFIINLTLACFMGATGASIAYLLTRVDATRTTLSILTTILLGALASATAFLIYSAELGVMTASSSASPTFPDPLFVTGISLVAGFNASPILRSLSSLASKLLPSTSPTPPAE